MIVIGQPRYSTPDTMTIIHLLKKQKTDALLIDVIGPQFCRIINLYIKGKLSLSKFIGKSSKLFGTDLSTGIALLDDYEQGKVPLDRLKFVDSHASLVHLIIQAKKLGCQVYPIPHVHSRFIEKEARKRINNDALVRTVCSEIEGNEDVFMDVLMDWSDKPVRLFEIVIGHNPDQNPFCHKTDCRVCRLRVWWARTVLSWGYLISKFLPRSVRARFVFENIFDKVVEEESAQYVFDVYNNLKTGFGREPVMISVVHLWHEIGVENRLSDMGVHVGEVHEVVS